MGNPTLMCFWRIKKGGGYHEVLSKVCLTVPKNFDFQVSSGEKAWTRKDVAPQSKVMVRCCRDSLLGLCKIHTNWSPLCGNEGPIRLKRWSNWAKFSSFYRKSFFKKSSDHTSKMHFEKEVIGWIVNFAFCASRRKWFLKQFIIFSNLERTLSKNLSPRLPKLHSTCPHEYFGWNFFKFVLYWV